MRATKSDTPKRQQKRRQIVEAAYAELAEVGFEGFRMRNVARRAGLDHATLHHYFEGKDQILVGVMQYIVEDRSVGKLANFEETLPDRRLEAHFEAVVSQMQTDPDLFLVIAEICVRALRDAEVRQVKTTFDGEWRTFLTKIVQAGIEVGAFRDDLIPEAGAEFIMCVVRGAQFTFGGDTGRYLPIFELLLRTIRVERP